MMVDLVVVGEAHVRADRNGQKDRGKLLVDLIHHGWLGAGRNRYSRRQRLHKHHRLGNALPILAHDTTCDLCTRCRCNKERNHQQRWEVQNSERVLFFMRGTSWSLSITEAVAQLPPT